MDKRRGYFLLSLTLALLAGWVGAVSAFATINAADGQIDAAWPAAALVVDGDDGFEISADINRAWLAVNQNTPTDLALRIETMGSIDTDSGTYYTVQIDCTNNDVFEDPEDLLLAYDATSGDLKLYTGDLEIGAAAANAAEGQGEVVGPGLNTVEARFNEDMAINQDLGITWTDCFAAPRLVRFLTSDTDTNVLDLTDPVPFNFYTAVKLSRFSLRSAAPGGVGLALLALASLLWLRRRARR